MSTSLDPRIIAIFAMKTNIAKFTHQVFSPAIFDEIHARGIFPGLNKSVLLGMWRTLRNRNLSRVQMEREREKFLDLFPSKISVTFREGQISRFLMYQHCEHHNTKQGDDETD